MQKVNALPIFLSQETDLKAKDSSSSSESSNKETDFSSLVEQHFPEENKAINETKSTVTEKTVAATQANTIAAQEQSDVIEVNNRQESDVEQSPDVNLAYEDTALDGKQRKESDIDTTSTLKNGSLAESEQFISLLYNSDQTLAKSEAIREDVSSNAAVNNTEIPVKNKLVDDQASSRTVAGENFEDDNVALPTEHKLSAFSKEELLARTQIKSNNAVATQSNDQILKDYQLLLQAQQNTTKSQSITSEQLVNAQLVTAQAKNKITDLAAGAAQANKSQLSEQGDAELYPLSAEANIEGELIAEDLSLSTNKPVSKAELTQDKNKVSQAVQFKGDIPVELAESTDNVADESTVSTVINSESPLKENLNNSETATTPLSKVNADRIDVERALNANAVLIEPSLKNQSAALKEKQPEMTTAQIQALQQAQVQKKVEAASSEQQVVDKAGEEAIDSAIFAESQSSEPSVKTTGKVIDNITMRTAADLQAQTVKATQAKQSNAAYFEHQVSEVLNHNVASDTVQIQKNNIQLQQETISIFRKDFADAVKDKVMLTINQKMQQFDITLDPPEFGNMQVRVNMQGEQASVNFVVQNQQAKDALEQNMHKLKDMLSEQGVDVGGANVEQQDQQQSANEQSLERNNNNGSLLANDANNDEDKVEHVLSAQLFDSSATGVDYYA
ncbi:flagellar hook-length control protein FliK [Colwellia psychrerythraea]|uniref:Flagellar hook-length control protein-like protein n=1 Tax=Colwellia psychrerythraea TaxID=28229 RepID=A0A099KKP2_COLPS|nr:flagellar hook-length control protein FliK [Colwellia psychrerythraea]KGJ91379.1 Flagellar hook-length control protein-like protein [Colwellia psychrerythraea]